MCTCNKRTNHKASKQAEKQVKVRSIKVNKHTKGANKHAIKRRKHMNKRKVKKACFQTRKHMEKVSSMDKACCQTSKHIKKHVGIQMTIFPSSKDPK